MRTVIREGRKNPTLDEGAVNLIQDRALQCLIKNRPWQTGQNRVGSGDVFRIEVVLQIGGAAFYDSCIWKFARN